MDKSLLIDLAVDWDSAWFELLIAGFAARYTFETNEGIPGQWQRYAAADALHDLEPMAIRRDGKFQVRRSRAGFRFRALPEAFATVRIRAQHCAVSHVRDAIRAWKWWAPNFECYSKEFKPMTGTGLIEVWMPVNDRTKETCYG